MPEVTSWPEIYEADNGEFGWRVQDGNSQVVASSHETYTRPEDAERALRNTAHEFAGILWQITRPGYEIPRVTG